MGCSCLGSGPLLIALDLLLGLEGRGYHALSPSPPPVPPSPLFSLQAASQRDPTAVPQLLSACVSALGEASAMRAVLVSIGDALQRRADPASRCVAGVVEVWIKCGGKGGGGAEAGDLIATERARVKGHSRTGPVHYSTLTHMFTHSQGCTLHPG